MNRLISAIDYAQLGWRVVPLHYPSSLNGATVCSCKRPECASQGKHPRIGKWPTEATTDIATIQAWWAPPWECSNVGIALGSASGVVAIDVDSDAGEQILHDMCGGNLPETCEMITSAGRRRFLFTIPESLEEDPRTAVITVKGKEALRFQGTGSQCVMPPSRHPSGSCYKWVVGRSPRDLMPAVMPPWLLVKMAKPDSSLIPEPQVDVKESQPEVYTPATEFNQRCNWFRDILGPAGFKEAGKSGETSYFTRPGKSGGVSVSLGHYKGRDGTPVLYVFSSSIPELPPLKTYDAFGAYARLFHGGNFAEAGRVLVTKGYGSLRRNRQSVGSAAAVVSEEPPRWPDPVPLRADLEPIPFPLEVFPDYLQQFVGSTAHALGVPVGYVAANVIGVAAGAIGATLNVQLTPDWRERACLFIAVVAPKSAGKTPAHLAAMSALTRVQAEQRQEEKQVFFTTDTTIEALAPLLVDKPRGLLVAADELSGFIGGMNQYKGAGKGGDRQFWLSIWTGSTIQVLRRNPEAPRFYIPHPCVSILGGVQPAVLKSVFSLDDGLAERFLFEASEPLPPSRVVRHTYQNAELWRDLVRQLAKREMINGEHGPVPHTLSITDEAWEAFADWSVESVGPHDRDQALDGFRSKAKSHAARLALLLHVMRYQKNDESIPNMEIKSMLNGIRLMKYYLAQTIRVRAEANSSPGLAEIVLNWIRQCGKSQITKRDVFRALRRQIPTSDDLREPLKKLVEHGFLMYAEPLGGWRKPDAVYLVRPELESSLSPLSPAVTRGGDGCSPCGERT